MAEKLYKPLLIDSLTAKVDLPKQNTRIFRFDSPVHILVICRWCIYANHLDRTLLPVCQNHTSNDNCKCSRTAMKNFR